MNSAAHVSCFGSPECQHGQNNPPLFSTFAPNQTETKLLLEELDDEEEEEEEDLEKEKEEFFEDELSAEADAAYEEEEQEVLDEAAKLAAEEHFSQLSVQFKQITVNNVMSCGIRLVEEDVLCWGHGEPKWKAFSIPGPVKQVSAGDDAICVLRQPPSGNSAGVGRDGTSGTVGESFKTLECYGKLANDIPLEDQESPDGWDQVITRKNLVCAVSMESELKCWGHSYQKSIFPSDLIIA